MIESDQVEKDNIGVFTVETVHVRAVSLTEESTPKTFLWAG
jgi:hypothetical protein